MVSTRRSTAVVVQKESTTSVDNSVLKSQTQLSLDERLSILSKPKNVTQPVLKRVPSTILQPVTRRPSLATMKSAGSFAKPKLSSTDLQLSEEESALASLTRTDSLHKLITAPAPPPAPPSTYKYVSSSGYGQSTGAPIRRTSIIVAAANAKASLSAVKSAPPPPPSSSKTSSSSFNRSSSFSRRASFSSSQLSLSFVAASSRKQTSSVSRMAMTIPSVDADTNDDELPSPLRRTLLAVISSSCLEAANLTQRGLFAAARTAYEALLTEVPLARRRAEVWIARASLESTAGDNAEGMEMLLKGAEACRAEPTEHTKITAALSAFARSAISGGTTAAIPIITHPSSTSSPLQTSISTSKNNEVDDDPFLLESLGLASSVPIIPKSDSVKRSEAFQAAMCDVISTCTNEPVPAFSLSRLSSPQQTHVESFGRLSTPPTFNSSAEDETYNSPAHAVSIDTDLGLEKFRSSTDDDNINYDEMASPPKPILKTTSKAVRVSDYIKHPSSSVLKAPFTPLALHSLASKTPVTTQRILNTQPRHFIESGASVSTPMLQPQPPFSVMVTPAVVLSARRVPVSSVPQIAKQFWELENEEEKEKTHQEENVIPDQESEFNHMEENIAPVSLSKRSSLKKTPSLTTPISSQDQRQDVMTSGKGKAFRKKTPKKTPAENSTRRSARLAGVSVESTDEDEIDDMMISLNSSLMNLQYLQ
jgi:hypothetical protein